MGRNRPRDFQGARWSNATHRSVTDGVFASVKSAAALSKTRHRGLGRVDRQFTQVLAAYNLMHLTKLLGAEARTVKPSTGRFVGCGSWRPVYRQGLGATHEVHGVGAAQAADQTLPPHPSALRRKAPLIPPPRRLIPQPAEAAETVTPFPGQYSSAEQAECGPRSLTTHPNWPYLHISGLPLSSLLLIGVSPSRLACTEVLETRTLRELH